MIKQIARSELAKNYAGAIAILLGALPAVGSLVVSVVTITRGEPYAEKTWATLRKQVDEQTQAINAINLKLTKMESLQEGLQLGKIQGELEALQKQYSRLREKIRSCPPGFSLIKDQCRAATVVIKPASAPATKMDDADQQKLDDTKRLVKDYMKQQKTMSSKKSPKVLSPLPPSP